MKITLTIGIFKEIEKRSGQSYSDFYSGWRDDSYETVVDLNIFSQEHIGILHDLIEEKMKDDQSGVYVSLKRKMSTYNKLVATSSSVKLKRLQDIPTAFISYVKNHNPSGLFYSEDADKMMNPYLVVRCEYNPFDERNQSPAYTEIEFKAVQFRQVVSKYISIYGDNLREFPDGASVSDILLNFGQLIPENQELSDNYNRALERYKSLSSIVGDVFVGINSGVEVSDDRWSREKRFFFKTNISPKVVVDFFGRSQLSSDRDNKSSNKDVIKNSSVLGKRMVLPVHPYGEVWHLEEHQWIQVHVDNLIEYKWKEKELLEKLILPQADKELIEILMNVSKMEIEDIIEGKTGGSFILATGLPGTGKTLSAEVFSEVLQKPLYKVQCSQLGINVDTVEQKLKGVLERASRWGAVLLLDEGDVYVRARKEDLNQNAIVGVFLRTLEYYRGILFMTSNLDTQIDDAILSRATAHLKYFKPNDIDRRKIWEVLSDQFELKFTQEEIDELNSSFVDIVGRDIKALLKLGKMLSTGNSERCTVELIKSVSKFVPNVNI